MNTYFFKTHANIVLVVLPSKPVGLQCFESRRGFRNNANKITVRWGLENEDRVKEEN